MPTPAPAAKPSFRVVKRNDLLPRCPHCEHELPYVNTRAKGLGLLVARHAVYFCPHCRKVLGIGPSRMI